MGSIQRRSTASGTYRASAAAILRRVVGWSSPSARSARLRTISPRAQNVMPSPYAGRPALVPVDIADQAVDVLLELPGEARLAGAGLSGDRHEAQTAIPLRGVQQVLEQPELLIAAHERRLEALGAADAAQLAHDAQRPPRGHRRGLALDQVLTRRLVGDALRGRPEGRLADQHAPGRRRTLEPTGGVDEVARDDALVRRRRGSRRPPR